MDSTCKNGLETVLLPLIISISIYYSQKMQIKFLLRSPKENWPIYSTWNVEIFHKTIRAGPARLIDSYVWVPSTTLLCSIFLPVLVKAIPCIGKDFGMSTIEYASLMVELQHDAYNSKTRESHIFEGNRADRFVRLGAKHYLVVLYFPASACQSHPMYR